MLILGLGIAVVTTMFSLLDAVLFRPLPYPDWQRIVVVRESEPGGEHAVAPPAYFDWRDEARSFVGIAAVSDEWLNLVGRGEPERVSGARVTAEFAAVMGVAPALGRWFGREHETPGSDQVVVISHGLWQRRFGGDPAVVGSSITLTDRSYTIIGVMPPGFDYPDGVDVWAPLVASADLRAPSQRLSHYLGVVARLAPGVSVEQADAELDCISAARRSDYPMLSDLDAPLEARLTLLRDWLVGEAREPLLILFGAVAFVLLVATANVAGLQLARIAASGRELAVRAAIGSGRARLVRHVVAESLLLSLAGGALGLLLTAWARDTLLALAPPDMPRIDGVRLDLRVFAFALGVAGLAGLLAGLVPAIAVTRADLAATLRNDVRRLIAPSRLRGALVVGELALSVLLLAGAGLMVRSLWRLVSVDPGFRTEGILTMEVTLPRSRYGDAARQAQFFTDVLRNVRALPGVDAAGGTSNLPLSQTSMVYGVYFQEDDPNDRAPRAAQFRAVNHGYLPALGVPLLRGRWLEEGDDEDAPPVALVNEAFARRFWPGRDPIGQRIALARGRDRVWREVVGVVGDVRHASLREPAQPEVYVPFQQEPQFFMRIVARGRADVRSLADGMRRAVWAVDAEQPVVAVRPLADIAGAHIAPARLQAALLGTFAALSVLLAAVGLYSVLAYAVAQRTREIGVRVALGATAADIARLVVGGAARLVGAGALLGLAGAAALTRVLRGLLFGVSPGDPATFGAVVAVLGGVALLASVVPAARAARIDHVPAIRQE